MWGIPYFSLVIPIWDSGSQANSKRGESGPIPFFWFICFRCLLLGTLNWLDDDELDGISFVCCKSPSGLLDAMHAGTKDLGLPKRGSLLQLHSNLWLLYDVAF